jgi:hypothetical protein
MRRVVVTWMVGLGSLAFVTAGGANGAHELTEEQLVSEMTRNRALAAYVARNGLPDVAETHHLSTRPPWDHDEVTLYYLEDRTEIGFARAFILGRPEVQIERYSRPLTDAQVAALSARPKLRRGDPTARAEDAALRAENAAGRVELAAASAERAADRAEAIAGKMESAFHRALRK